MCQVALIERTFTRTVRLGTSELAEEEVKTAVAVFIITSLDAREAAPATWPGDVRGDWTIENKAIMPRCH